MKKILLLLGVMISTVTFAFQAKVTEILSGDTFVILRNEGQVKVRMLGIDAPELKQTYGEEAKKYLSQLILNKDIEVKEDKLDKYNRVVGEIFLGEKNINIEMLKTGNAWCLRSQKDVVQYTDAQKNAKREKKGLWKEENPKSPWKFREENS